MNTPVGTQDYEPIWRRQLREAAEKLEAIKLENQRKREEQQKLLDEPEIINVSIGK